MVKAATPAAIAPRRRVQSWVVLCGVASLLATTSCSPSGPSPLPPPRTDAPPELPVQPPTGSRGEQVSTAYGFAYEHTRTGVQPLAHFPLQVHAMKGKFESVLIDVTTDANGRYEVPGLLREFLMVGARQQDAYLSPCSVRMWLWSDLPHNVHVVSRELVLAGGLPRSMPPLSQQPSSPHAEIASGFVTEQLPDGGTRPVAGALVEHFYGDGRSGHPTGYTVTDAEGRYVLCGYWDDYGQTVRVSKDRYRTSFQEIGGSWQNDFVIVREFACLRAAPPFDDAQGVPSNVEGRELLPPANQLTLL
jgi:hypothetical protein